MYGFMVNPKKKTRPARHVNEEKLHEIFYFEHKIILEYMVLFNIQNSTPWISFIFIEFYIVCRIDQC